VGSAGGWAVADLCWMSGQSQRPVHAAFSYTVNTFECQNYEEALVSYFELFLN